MCVCGWVCFVEDTLLWFLFSDRVGSSFYFAFGLKGTLDPSPKLWFLLASYLILLCFYQIFGISRYALVALVSLGSGFAPALGLLTLLGCCQVLGCLDFGCPCSYPVWTESLCSKFWFPVAWWYLALFVLFGSRILYCLIACLLLVCLEFR
ncbi:hypothetical protein U1Q18_007355 [Sarracenia purpurea var. burkii]